MAAVKTGIPVVNEFPILIEILSLGINSGTPVRKTLSTLALLPNGRIRLVVTVNGSPVNTRLVTLKTFARPPGPSAIAILKISGLAGTIVTVERNIVPLLFMTKGKVLGTVERPNTAGGTTKSIRWRLTYFRPHAAPLIVIVTPLNSIGRVKLRLSEPTPDLVTIGRSNPA